jgi:hypothetical protein
MLLLHGRNFQRLNFVFGGGSQLCEMFANVEKRDVTANSEISAAMFFRAIEHIIAESNNSVFDTENPFSCSVDFKNPSGSCRCRDDTSSEEGVEVRRIYAAIS